MLTSSQIKAISSIFISPAYFHLFISTINTPRVARTLTKRIKPERMRQKKRRRRGNSSSTFITSSFHLVDRQAGSTQCKQQSGFLSHLFINISPDNERTVAMSAGSYKHQPEWKKHLRSDRSGCANE